MNPNGLHRSGISANDGDTAPVRPVFRASTRNTCLDPQTGADSSGLLATRTITKNLDGEKLNGGAVPALLALLARWVERFHAKVQRTASCHVWRGARQTNGYGSFGAGGGTTSILAHRVAWVLERGLIPEGLTVDHLCANRLCQRVEHMELVTCSENSRRAAARRRALKAVAA